MRRIQVETGLISAGPRHGQEAVQRSYSQEVAVNINHGDEWVPSLLARHSVTEELGQKECPAGENVSFSVILLPGKPLFEHIIKDCNRDISLKSSCLALLAHSFLGPLIIYISIDLYCFSVVCLDLSVFLDAQMALSTTYREGAPCASVCNPFNSRTANKLYWPQGAEFKLRKSPWELDDLPKGSQLQSQTCLRFFL